MPRPHNSLISITLASITSVPGSVCAPAQSVTGAIVGCKRLLGRTLGLILTGSQFSRLDASHRDRKREFSTMRVYTRQQPKPNGAWKGWNEWPMPDGGEGGLPYFDIPLK